MPYEPLPQLANGRLWHAARHVPHEKRPSCLAQAFNGRGLPGALRGSLSRGPLSEPGPGVQPRREWRQHL
eukprot:2571932-Lingulodinium_polyedra.AAC.1